MSDFPAFQSLDGTLTQVWQHLSRGVADRRSPARHPVLATTGPAGAEARVVVLRAADPSAGTLEVHTDAASPKVAQLREDPRATLLVWAPSTQFQIRLQVRVAIVTGPGPAWDRVPPPSRMNYSGPVPGTPLPRGDAETRVHRRAPDQGRAHAAPPPDAMAEARAEGPAPNDVAKAAPGKTAAHPSPHPSRAQATGISAPGSRALDLPAAPSGEPPQSPVSKGDPARFARLIATVEAIDTLHLGQEGHRRALFLRADGFAGAWLAP